VFGVVFTTLAMLPWYTGIVLAVAEFFGMHHVRLSLSLTTYHILLFPLCPLPASVLLLFPP
jgi:predicted small integral membrane protein